MSDHSFCRTSLLDAVAQARDERVPVGTLTAVKSSGSRNRPQFFVEEAGKQRTGLSSQFFSTCCSYDARARFLFAAILHAKHVRGDDQ